MSCKKKRIYGLKGNKLSEPEKLEICKLLIKAGYAAKLGKEKLQGKSTYIYYIEYWEDIE